MIQTILFYVICLISLVLDSQLQNIVVSTSSFSEVFKIKKKKKSLRIRKRYRKKTPGIKQVDVKNHTSIK